jgi:hypothetical protein|tara:strand:+ start:1985 stop:2242 length:258 start_codon:yes stop_codon:yes gene_type:complete
MAESYEFNVFNDRMKRQYLLDNILQGEIQIFATLLTPVAENHPDYAEWKYGLDQMTESISNLKKVYEKLGGTYDLGDIKNVVNNT